MGLGATLVSLCVGLAEEGLVLRWSGPAPCPSTEQVAARIDGLLGPVAGRPSAGAVVVEGLIGPSSEGFTLELTLRTASGETRRDMSSPSCEVLAEATALAVAIAFEVEANAARAQVRAPALATPEPSPPAPAPRRRRAGLALDALFAVEYGALPVPGLGVDAQARAIVERWQVGARGLVLPEQAAATELPGVTAYTMLWAAGPQVCFVPAWGRVELAACALAEAGQLRARSRGVARPMLAAPLWVAAGAGVALVVRVLPNLALRVGADGVGHLRPLRFTVDGRQVHAPHPAGIRGWVGLELRLDGR